MEGYPSSNGHHPTEDAALERVDSPAEATPRRLNPYADALTGTKPREIIDYELNSDPYANMLPNIAGIKAAKVISRSVEVGSRGNRLAMIISLVLVIVLIVPLILAVFSQLSG